MSDFSISKSLRTTTKVNSGLAPNAWSERYMDADCLGVCPQRFAVDEMYRGAPHASLTELTAGCNSAMDRILIETQTERPYYLVRPLDAEGMAQYTPGGGYDTLGNNAFNRQRMMGLTQHVNLPGCQCAGHMLSPQQERCRFSNAMRHHNQGNFVANDCN